MAILVLPAGVNHKVGSIYTYTYLEFFPALSIAINHVIVHDKLVVI